MKQHAYFDLQLPDDMALADMLETTAVTRTTLHEWPLSCVERVSTADGRIVICKSISGPLVEPRFYTQIGSGLLPACRVIYQDENYAVMLLEIATGVRGDRLAVSPAEAHGLAVRVTHAIRSLPAHAPVFMDLSTSNRWHTLTERMCDRLSGLIHRGFGSLTHDHVSRVQALCRAPTVVDTVRREPGLIHADLTGDNLFVDGDRITVIDWQFPRRGPRAADIATLLRSLGVDPVPMVGPGAVVLVHLLRIEWFVQCTERWFPPGRATYAASIGQNLEEAEATLSS